MPVGYITSYSSSQLDAISGMYFFIWPGESVLFSSASGCWHVNLKLKERKWKKPSTSCKNQKIVLETRTALYGYDTFAVFLQRKSTIEKNNRPTQLPTQCLMLVFSGRGAVIHHRPDSASTEVIWSFASGFSRWKNRIWAAIDEEKPALEKFSPYVIG